MLEAREVKMAAMVSCLDDNMLDVSKDEEIWLLQYLFFMSGFGVVSGIGMVELVNEKTEL